MAQIDGTDEAAKAVHANKKGGAMTPLEEMRDGQQAVEIIRRLLFSAYEGVLEAAAEDLDDDDQDEFDELAEFAKVVTGPAFRVALDAATKHRPPGATADQMILAMRREVAAARTRRKIVALPTTTATATGD